MAAHMDNGAAAEASTANDRSDLLQTPCADSFVFSDTEQRALQLYDQLRELELEKSLLQAHAKGVSDASAPSDHVLQEHLMAAEREAMEAKARFEIRNKISHNVLIMDPVLKAVHGGHQHTLEKRILPLTSESDAASMVLGLSTARLTNTQRALGAAEQGNVAASKENRNRATAVLSLAEGAKAQSIGHVGNPLLQEQVRKAEASANESRKRATIIKGILSAAIVGSGINWAADEELRELVMDDEEAG